jgi:hypothetical protein
MDQVDRKPRRPAALLVVGGVTWLALLGVAVASMGVVLGAVAAVWGPSVPSLLAWIAWEQLVCRPRESTPVPAPVFDTGALRVSPAASAA